MILAIAIISGILFLIEWLADIIADEPKRGFSLACAGSILVLSSWYLNTVLGIIFLVLCCILFVIILLKLVAS